MAAFGYRYELRRGDEVIATGHVTRDEAVEEGERIVLGGWAGIVRSVDPILGEQEQRLVVQIVRGER